MKHARDDGAIDCQNIQFHRLTWRLHYSTGITNMYDELVRRTGMTNTIIMHVQVDMQRKNSSIAGRQRKAGLGHNT